MLLNELIKNPLTYNEEYDIDAILLSDEEKRLERISHNLLVNRLSDAQKIGEKRIVDVSLNNLLQEILMLYSVLPRI